MRCISAITAAIAAAPRERSSAHSCTVTLRPMTTWARCIQPPCAKASAPEVVGLIVSLLLHTLRRRWSRTQAAAVQRT